MHFGTKKTSVQIHEILKHAHKLNALKHGTCLLFVFLKKSCLVTLACIYVNKIVIGKKKGPIKNNYEQKNIVQTRKLYYVTPEIEMFHFTVVTLFSGHTMQMILQRIRKNYQGRIKKIRCIVPFSVEHVCRHTPTVPCSP